MEEHRVTWCWRCGQPLIGSQYIEKTVHGQMRKLHKKCASLLDCNFGKTPNGKVLSFAEKKKEKKQMEETEILKRIAEASKNLGW